MAANWLSPHSFSAYILAYNSTVSVVYSFLGRMAVVLMLQVGGGGRTSSRKHITFHSYVCGKFTDLQGLNK